MPLTKLQSNVLRTLALQRSPDSYVAGGVALNREGPRFSGDIDIFQDSEERLTSAAEADAAALIEAGFKFSWRKVQTGKREAQVQGGGEAMQLEWVADSDFRFYPTQPDELFGYVLHPVDLATNKASAAADRREPRDIVDLVTVHESILPLGAVVCAAVGRFPGLSPEEMLAGNNAAQPIYGGRVSSACNGAASGRTGPSPMHPEHDRRRRAVRPRDSKR